MLYTQLRNRSFYDVDWTRMAAKCTKEKNAHATRAKLLFILRNRAICNLIVAVVEVVVYASLCLKRAFEHIHMKSVVCTSLKLIIL